MVTLGYQVATVSVTSASAPVSLIPPGFMFGGFTIRNRSASAVAALIFPYTGALPPSPPSGVYELAPGANLQDNLASASSGADNALGSGWAAVLASGTTPITVDVIYR
jgi:hypothetical protein